MYPRRKKWSRKKSSTPKVDERFCSKCNNAYQHGPLPKHLEEFITGNVSAYVYPSGSWKPNGMIVKVGRWRIRSDKHFLSEVFDSDDLNDLVKSIAKAHRYIQTVKAQNRRPDRRRTG